MVMSPTSLIQWYFKWIVFALNDDKSVLISSTTKNIHQQTFFLWLRRDVDELKLISDDKKLWRNLCRVFVNKTRRD